MLALGSPDANAVVRTWKLGLNGGNMGTTGNWDPAPASWLVADDYIMGDVENPGAGITRTGTMTMNQAIGSLSILQSTGAASGTNLNLVKLGNAITLSGTAPLVMQGVEHGWAVLDFNGVALSLNYNGADKVVTFGDYTLLANSFATPVTFEGGYRPANTNGGLTSRNSRTILNFDGGQVNGSTINLNGVENPFIINITKAMGNGTLLIQSGAATRATEINLNAVGVLDLGVKLVNYGWIGANDPSTMNVTVANTMTGLSSGMVTTQFSLSETYDPLGPASAFGASQAVYGWGSTLSPIFQQSGLINASTNGLVLTFAAGAAAAFVLDGGILDVRRVKATGYTDAPGSGKSSMPATVSVGSIVTNGRDIVINSGGLLGMYLTGITSGGSTTSITLNGGHLALMDTSAWGTITAPVDFTVGDTGDLAANTIIMGAGSTGTLSLNNMKAASSIYIPLLADGGTWNRGTINANSFDGGLRNAEGYRIANDATHGFGASGTFASFTIADGCGLNGLDFRTGRNGIPAKLTLGADSSFFALLYTPTNRTYNVGDAASNDVITKAAGSGGFTFGFYETNTGQNIINLNRNVGNDTITLVANNGNSPTINLTTSHSGSGTLYLNARIINLLAGQDIGGTVTVANDLALGSNSNEALLGNPAGGVQGSGISSVIFNVNGSLSGTNVIALSPDGGVQGTLVMGASGSISAGAVQDWYLGAPNSTTMIFDNKITDAAQWAADAIVKLTLTRATGGTLEASTSTANPGTSPHYRFDVLNIVQSQGFSGYLKLVDTTENDGPRANGKEAFYAGSLNTINATNSNANIILNLNGLDLWLDQFASADNARNINTSGAFTIMNDKAGSVSDLRAITQLGQKFNTGSFRVANNSAIEIVNGDWYSVQHVAMSADRLPSDTAAMANNSENTKTQSSGGNTAISSEISFLGSGGSNGGNAATTAMNTGGAMRVINGSFTAAGYVLNPVGTVGLIDTTTTYAGGDFNGISVAATTAGVDDNTLDNVIFRAQAASTVTRVSGGNTLELADTSVWRVGDMLTFASLPNGGGLSTSAKYYVVSVDGNKIQLSTTPGGPAMEIPAAWVSANTTKVTDMRGIQTTALPALVVAGTTAVIGHLKFTASPGAVNQATLRVGAVTTAGAMQNTSELDIAGDIYVSASNNLAIQSNATVKVGGNVEILGKGVNQTQNVTGTGVGIGSQSHFVLNGNTGAAAPQEVNIAAAVGGVGNFHVGDGADGVLTAGIGQAAAAKLTADLLVKGAMDINGASSLDLNGKTLTVEGSGIIIGRGGLLKATVGETNPLIINSALTQIAGGADTATRGALSLADGATGKVRINGDVTVGVGGGASLMEFDLDSSISDRLTITGNLNMAAGGALHIDIKALEALSEDTYTLVSMSGGGSVGTGENWSMDAVDSGQLAFANGSGTMGVRGKRLTFDVGEDYIAIQSQNSLVYNLSVAPSVNRVILNAATNIGLRIENDGNAGDTLAFEGLNAQSNRSGDVLGGTPGDSATDGEVALGGTGSVTSITFTGKTVGQVVLTPTLSTARNSSVTGNSAEQEAATTLGSVIGGTLTVVDNRQINATAVNYGTLFVGGTGSAESTLSSAASHDAATDVTVNGVVFNGVTTSSTLALAQSFATSGNQSGNLVLTEGSNSAGVTITGEGLQGETVNNITVAYSANVYERAQLAATTEGSGGTRQLVLTNDASDTGAAGQRAGVTLVGDLQATNTNFNNGLFTLNATGPDTALGDAHADATSGTFGSVTMNGGASLKAARLNGTYVATISGSLQYTNATLRTQESPGIVTWSLDDTAVGVSGNASTGTASVFSADFSAGQSYAGFGLDSGLPASAGGGDTVGNIGVGSVALLGGNAGAAHTVSIAFVNAESEMGTVSDIPDAQRLSDIVSLSGLDSGSLIVLSLTFDPGLSNGEDVSLLWYNGSAWVDAVAGNSAGGGSFFANTAFDIDNPGLMTLGSYGYDGTTAWAVIDSRSAGLFAVGVAPVPEPATWALLIGTLGSMALARRLRRGV